MDVSLDPLQQGLWIVVDRGGPGRSLQVGFSVGNSDQTRPGGTACETWA